MARSSYIYIVCDRMYEATTIVAAFTVKYEMEAWANRRDPNRVSFEYYRIRDGVRNRDGSEAEEIEV